jgi:hypothetical protein
MPTPQISTTTFKAWYKEHGMLDADMGQPQEITEVWIIERKVDTGVNPLTAAVRFVEDDYRLMQVEGAVPYVGQRYVDWYPNSKNWMQFATLTSKTFQFVDNGRVQVTTKWFAPFHTSSRWWTTNPGPSTPIDIAYDLSVDYSTSYRGTEMFRASVVTAPPATADSTASDIGGVPTIPGMQGQPFQIEQLRIRVRRAVDFKYLPQAQLLQVFTPQLNTLNDTAFLAGTLSVPNPAGGANLSVAVAGYPRGTVLLESFSVIKTEGQYGEIVFDFLHEDYYAFHDQIPQLDPDGSPKRNATGDELADVRWKRVPRGYTEHNKVFFDQAAYNGSAWVPAASAGYTRLALQGWWAA